MPIVSNFQSGGKRGPHVWAKYNVDSVVTYKDTVTSDYNIIDLGISVVGDYRTGYTFDSDTGLYTLTGDSSASIPLPPTGSSFTRYRETTDKSKIIRHVKKNDLFAGSSTTGYLHYATVASTTNHKGDTNYGAVTSTDKNAYPDNGEQDGFWYVRIPDTSIHTYDFTLPAGRMRGDVTGDGEFTQEDADLLMDAVNESVQVGQDELVIYDVNGNGEIDLGDLIMCAKTYNHLLCAGECGAEVTGNWTNNPNAASEEGQFYTDIAVPGLTPYHDGFVSVSGSFDPNKIARVECMADVLRVYVTLCPISEVSCTLSYHAKIGSYPKLQRKIVKPTESGFDVTADAGYDGLSNVFVDQADVKMTADIILPPGRMKGDFDGDGIVTQAEANRFSRYVADFVDDVITEDQANSYGDLDSDGIITGKDVSVLDRVLHPNFPDYTIGKYCTDTLGNWTSNPNSVTEAGQFYVDVLVPGMTSQHTAYLKVNNDFDSTRITRLECKTDLLRVYVTLCPIAEVPCTVTYQNGIKLVDKTVTPGVSDQCVEGGGTYYGLSKVIVSGDPDLVAENIKTGASIFGVDGTFTGEGITAPPALQSKTVTPSTVDQTVTPGTGYDGLSSVTVKAMPSGALGSPEISVSTSGVITAKSTVGTAGYLPTTANISGTKSLTTKSAATITPGKTNQTIASQTYLTGTQTIKGDSNLSGENIKAGVSIFGVPGEYVGEGVPGGVDTSDANATNQNIELNKTAYVNGVKITGQIPAYDTTSMTFDNATSDGSGIVVNGSRDSKFIMNAGGTASIRVPGSEFGNAEARDVLFGKTFTSADGLLLQGAASSGRTYVWSKHDVIGKEEYVLTLQTYYDTKPSDAGDTFFSGVMVSKTTGVISFTGALPSGPSIGNYCKSISDNKSAYKYEYRMVGYPPSSINTYGLYTARLKTVNYQGDVDYGYVESTDKSTYPSNGELDGFWYKLVSEPMGLNLQSKEVTPANSDQTVVYDEGYDGLSKVKVFGDVNLSTNNIKKGVSIFGLDGTYDGPGTNPEANIYAWAKYDAIGLFEEKTSSSSSMVKPGPSVPSDAKLSFGGYTFDPVTGLFNMEDESGGSYYVKENPATDIWWCSTGVSGGLTTYNLYHRYAQVVDGECGDELLCVVTSSNYGAYPTNGVSGRYWYVAMPNTSDADAEEIHLLAGKHAYARGNKLLGRMPNNGAVNKEMIANGTYTIPQGYHDGNGTVTVNVPNGGLDTSDANATDQNIEEGYSAYVNGVKVDGKLPAGSILYGLGASAIYETTERIHVKSTAISDKIVRANVHTIDLDVPKYGFGDAARENVDKGVFFTSTAGLKVEGTREPDGGAVPVLQEKTVTPTTSQQTVIPDGGYGGLSKVTVNAMPSGGVTMDAITVDENGDITATAVRKAGYILGGTTSTHKQLTTKGATTITPGPTEQRIASGTYLTGDIVIKAISGGSSGSSDPMCAKINIETAISTTTDTKILSGNTFIRDHINDDGLFMALIRGNTTANDAAAGISVVSNSPIVLGNYFMTTYKPAYSMGSSVSSQSASGDTHKANVAETGDFGRLYADANGDVYYHSFSGTVNYQQTNVGLLAGDYTLFYGLIQ